MNFVIEKENWFPTNIFYTKINKDITLNIKNIVEKEKESWVNGLKNVRAKTSGFDGLRYPELEEIANFCCSKVLPNISKEFQWKVDNWHCEEAWINLYQKGDSTNSHVHFTSDYSAILIVEPGESNLKFHDPKAINSMYKFFEDVTDRTINEEEGTFIFFPSWLYHSVTECKKERITTAFNFKAVL
jgi:uncharacterized protein (TIGR02466 family)